jgi:hypothetical protein
MPKRLLLAIVSFFIVCTSIAQFDTSFVKKNIRQCADSMMYGFKTKNWNLFARYSYPAIVGSMGGVKGFTDYIGSMFDGIPDSSWKRYEPGKILQVVKAGRDFQTVIELHSVLVLQGYRVTSTSYLFGESWDGGLFWTFFDSQGDAEATRQINGNLSPLLKFPKPVEKHEKL